MYDDAEAKGVVMSRLAFEGDACKRPVDAFGVAVSGKDGVIVKLENSNIDPRAYTYVQTAAKLHGKARLTVLYGEVKLREEIKGLLLPVGVTRYGHSLAAARGQIANDVVLINAIK
jgi:hypothetical protein